MKNKIISTENRKTVHFHLLRYDNFLRILELNCDKSNIPKRKLKKQNYVSTIKIKPKEKVINPL